MTSVDLFCDGSCLGNPGPGGYAALLVVMKDGVRHEKVARGGALRTTNNQMELTAAIEGLRLLKRPCRVRAHTDSNYVVKGMSEWIAGWKRKGWKTSAGKPVENRALWEDLLAQAEPHDVSWHWVKGHAGHPENERVDELARTEAMKHQERARGSV